MIKLILSLFLLMATCTSPKTEQSLPISNPADIQYNRFSTGDQYLQVKIHKTDTKKQKLIFDLSWKGSWRADNAYDAAWIFIKQKDENGIWKHLRLEKGSVKLIQNNSTDQAPAAHQVSPDQVGLMVYRSQDGAGDNDWRLEVSFQKDSDVASSELMIFGLEMVHIAAGPFEIGTLKNERDRREELTPGAGGAPYNPFFTYKEQVRNNYGGPFHVSSEKPISIGKEEGNLYWIDANIPGTNTFSGVPEGQLSEAFPKGFSGFYQMKYELSQQEYCDFLNTLNSQQQKARDFTSTIEFDRPIDDRSAPL